ncbi:serine/threonine-protein kinase [Streptomyces ficellus]|uniref:Serine/threonine protein kinase n=1 Tax=Streptomyces ficellus TaxID=1977088 RepID=A0A6I6FK00_9ACTN|nr:serine/threonine-protein kinase [Streptomyces ficellus]QGV77818.1 serine/threonine protein kinase [Streptomyces ficellus]
MSGGPARQGTVFQPLEGDDPRSVAGYRLAARLGAGGMGKVYLSYTPGGRPVAIKVIRPDFAEDAEFRRRFAQEVKSAQRVQGLYTAPVIDSDTDARQPWLATAYVPGPSLADAVQAHGRLPVDTVLLLVAGIAEALQVIHGAGIVHRDLKPANVLLAADGPRVIDFGIARAADATSLTGSGVTIGTPSFMSPEQAAGRTVTAATDIFALGQVTAYAALGSPAFGEGTSHGVLYRIVHEEPQLDGLPDRLRELVTRCLAKDPAERPSVADILTLCQAASDQTTLRRPEEWLPGAVAADITTRAAAPAPVAATTPPPPAQPPTAPAAPAAPATPPPAQAPQQAPAAHAPTAHAAPATPPPGFGPAPTQPHTHASAPAPGYGYPQTHPAPGAPGYGYPQAHPTPPPHTGPAPVGATTTTATPPRKKTKRNLLLALTATLLVAGLAGGGVYYLMKGDDTKGGNQAAKSGDPATGDSTPAQQEPVDNAPGGATPSPETPSSQKPPEPVADPEPATYQGIDLTDGYHLTLADDPVKPLGDDANVDVAYDWSLEKISVEDGRLILLRAGQKGDLNTCRTETRYADRVDLDSLSKGSQLCVLTNGGHVGLVTYQGKSPESDPSHYVTLDVTVWRGAIAAEGTS